MITIIILLILAGVAIVQLTDSGLFEKSRLAKEKAKNSQVLENSILGDYENEIVAIGNRDTVTLSKEEYELLIGKTKLFIDTNRKLAEIAKTKTSGECSYTATENCMIVGSLRTYGGGIITITINTEEVGKASNADTTVAWMGVPVNYYLAKGDTIKFSCSSSGTKQIEYVYAYGLK